ncbi:MAG: TIGR03086 family metal-binding protein [Actinomycetota bacterium]|nr:TIGR03086 family metal-binding protein [Actinomycetota bacterium]MEC9270836.1 TIGR03086 family metal-binding protein [Actinomycetota bacterium]MEC9316724.1 TIGR03086 family metal-binding protein [Actinomycetota bacterium]
MSANRRRYVKALYGFDAVVQRVEESCWGSESPCEGWSALDVLAHNVGMCEMIAGIARGIPADTAQHPTLENPKKDWIDARDDVLEALDQPGALEIEVGTPWGHLAVDRFVGIVAVDPLLHTFDLAKSSGQAVVLDEELAKAAYNQLEKAGDMIRGERFGPAVPVAPDASITDKLIAIAGRNP